jgi:transposase
VRVEDFIKLYYGRVRKEVEIYAIVTVFHEGHRVLVRNFDIDCTKAYTTKKRNLFVRSNRFRDYF